MAVPASFEESNAFLDSAPGDEEIVAPLAVWRGIAYSTESNVGLMTVISCWKFTAEELAEINRTGRVWLAVLGQTMPPVWVVGTKPFAEEKQSDSGTREQ